MWMSTLGVDPMYLVSLSFLQTQPSQVTDKFTDINIKSAHVNARAPFHTHNSAISQSAMVKCVYQYVYVQCNTQIMTKA